MFTEKLTGSKLKSKRKIVMIFLYAIFLLCTTHVASAYADEGGGSNLVQGANDNNTIHENPVQAAVELTIYAIFLKVLAHYRLP